MNLKAARARGTDLPWYKGRNLTEQERATFRATTIAAQKAKRRALSGECVEPKHPVNKPNLNALSLMPKLSPNGLKALSLFSGGGGMDIGFHQAGYTHAGSYEILDSAAAVLKAAHPDWTVFGGAAGDVTKVDWSIYRDQIDVLHGGPPCQPFSHAGRRQGANDQRDMIPAIVAAIKAVRPRAFAIENVSGLLTKRFEDYVRRTILVPLSDEYVISMFTLEAADFGVPQKRKRVFFVGFRNVGAALSFRPPARTHSSSEFGNVIDLLPNTMGVRQALGLPDIGADALAPTIRSGFTGPRHTTSVLNSVSALRVWNEIEIWPNGVAESREKASAYIVQNGHFRLSVPDCLLIQGFPEDWPVGKPVYVALGLIGNAVAPPMAYNLAKAIQGPLQLTTP